MNLNPMPKSIMLRATNTTPSDRDGFTLLEMAIVLVILSVLLGAVSRVMISTNLFSGDYTRILLLNQTGWRLLDRLSAEIRGADPTSVTPVVMVNSSWITFRTVLGYSGGAPVLSDPITFGYQAVTGETLDQTDENGDGRADEGVVEYTSDDPAVTIEIAGNVTDLRFNPITNGIEFSIDVALVDEAGEEMSKTFTQKVTFRN